MGEVKIKMRNSSQVSMASAKHGQDFCFEDQSDFMEYLAKHETNGVYQAPLNSQQALIRMEKQLGYYLMYLRILNV
jgi:hypothetical protein